MSAFGPGSAFGSFAPIGGQSGAQRPSRGRMTSSGSFKDLTSATNHTDQSWDTSASDLHTPNSSALLQNGSASNDALTANSDSLTSASTHNRANGSDSSTKRFVYSREFLLSLYDDEKVQKRPVELSKHAIATLEQARAPWALKGFKEGERELFSSIHPPNMRSNRNQTQNSNRNAGGSNESSNMLDLASLGALPRDRDRLRGSNVASTSAGNATEEGATGVRRAKSVHSTGILGGVLDGIAPAAPRRRDSSFEKGKGAEDESPADTVPKADLQPWTAATSKDSSLLEPLQPAGKDEEGEVNDLAPSKEQLPSSVQQVQTGFGSLSLGPDSLFDDPLLGSLRPSSAAKAQPSSLFQAPAAPIREPTPEPVINDPNWQYRDPSGQVQGPFPAKLMHDWYCQHFFTGDLMVKRVSDTDYETLDDLIRRCGSAEKPFLDGVSLASAAKKKDKPVVVANTASQPASAQESSGRFGESSSFPKQDGLDRSVTESLWGSAPAQGHQNIALDASARRDAGANLLAQLQRSSQSPAFDAAPRVDLLQQLLAQQQLHSSQQQQHPLYGISGLLPQHQQFGAANAPLPPPVYHGDFVQQQQQHQQMQHAMWQQQQQFPFGPGAAVSGAPTMPSQHSSAPQVAHPGPFAASPPAPQPVTSPWLSGEPVAVPVTESHPQHLSPQQQHQQHQYQHQEAHRSPEPSVSAAPSAKSPAEQVASLPEARASQGQYQPQDEQPAAAHPAKPVVPAPWVKAEEEKQANATPSLREIQEAEAKALEAKRAAEKAQQARLQAAAAMRAAQQAAAEAESLPSSSTWANTNSTPSASPTGVKAPWLNRSSSTGAGKTLKEIQEEEERERQKAAAQAAAQQQAVGAGPRGYASLASKPSNPGAGWTTVAAKPTPTASQAPKQRPVIPGLLAPASSSASVTKLATAAPAASRPAAPVVAAKSSTPVKAAAVQSASPAAAARPRANGPQSYSIDNPPPPSSEFMKWCREALKGLNVPMDEFIQMLLSFPLDASPDVLEIISDSVYANSSTLDGRRFANDFTSRRKLDVAARYPQILSLPKSALVNGSGVRPAAGAATSMADALKMPPQPKPTEWSVPVGQKKKGKAQR